MSDQNKKMELENIPACLIAHEMEDNPKNANDTNKYLFLKAIELSPSKLSTNISDRTLNSESDDELVHETSLKCEKLNENDSLRLGICYAEKGTKSADTDLHDIKADDMNLIPESPKLTQEKDVRFLSPLAVVYEYSVSQNTYSQSTQSIDGSDCSQSLVEKCIATDQQESNKTEMEIALNPQEKIETEKSVKEHVYTESMTPGGDCHSTQLREIFQREKNISAAIDLVDSISSNNVLPESNRESKLATECTADATSINALNVVTEYYVAVGTKETLPIDSGAMQNIDTSKNTYDTLSSSKLKETVTTELLAGQMSESIEESMCVTGINLVTGIRKENNICQIMTNITDNDIKSSPEAIENQRVKSEDHSESIKDSVNGINLITGIREENNIGQIMTNLTDNGNKSSPEVIENQRLKSEDHSESIKDSINGINLETGIRKENIIGQIMTNLTDNDNKSSPEVIENQRVKSEDHSESIKDSVNGINLETGFRREINIGLTITNITDNDSKSSPEAQENQAEQTADHSQNCSQHLFPDSNPDLLQSGKRNTDDVSEESNILAESTQTLRDNVSDNIAKMNNNSKAKEAHDTGNQDTREPGCAVEIDRMVDSEETIGSSEGFTVSINDSQNKSQKDLFEDDPTSKTFVQETEKSPCNTSKETIKFFINTPQKLSVCDILKEVGEKNVIKNNTLNEKQNNPLQLNEDIEHSDIGIADTTCKINNNVLHVNNVSITDTAKRKLLDKEHEPSPKRKRVLDEFSTFPQIYTESSPKATERQEVKSADHSQNCSQGPSSDSNVKLLQSGKRNIDTAVSEDIELAESNQTLQITVSDTNTEMSSNSKTKEAHDTDNQDTREPGCAVEIDRMLDSETIGSSKGSNKSVNDGQNNSQNDLFEDDPTCKTFVQETRQSPSNSSKDTNKLLTFSGSDTLKEDVEKNMIKEDTLNEHQNIKTIKSQLHEDIEHSDIGVVDATCKSNKMFLYDDNVSLTVTEKRKLSDGEQEQITKRKKVLDESSVMHVPQKHKTSRDANNELYAKVAKLSDDQNNLEYQAILGEKGTNCMIETLVTLASKAVNSLEENTVWTGRSNESLVNETNVKYEKYRNEMSKKCEQMSEITNIDKELSKDKAEAKQVHETQNENYKDNVYSTEQNSGTILENDSNTSTSNSTRDELVLKRDKPGSNEIKMHISQETKLNASPVFISALEYSQGSTGFEPTDLNETVVMSSQGSAQSVPFAGNHSMMEVSEDGVQTTDIINNSGRYYMGGTL